jgi:hypothetical protein
VRCDDVVATLANHLFEFLFVGVGECELNDVVGKSLHFAGDSESLTINLVVFLRFFVVNGVETVRNRIVFAESLLGSHHWKRPFRTNLNHE